MKVVNESALKVEYIQHSGSDLVNVNSAKVSRDNKAKDLDQKAKDLLNYLASNKHMTPFEHNSITFIIECPLYIRSQIHRHRTFSYNEMSGRYMEIPDIAYIPSKFKGQSLKNKQGSEGEFTKEKNDSICSLMEYSCIKAYESYERLLNEGVSREYARSVLPQNMMTKFYMTGNLRNWFGFLALRLDSHAQEENRIIARKVLKELMTLFPISCGALAKSNFNKEILIELGFQQKEE